MGKNGLRLIINFGRKGIIALTPKTVPHSIVSIFLFSLTKSKTLLLNKAFDLVREKRKM
jgi:hypothetical protein